MYVAIWPLNALRKEDYSIVPAAQIKRFHPKDEKDFVAKNLYKYKSPSALKSSQVFILALAETEDGLKTKMTKTRIQYPNRKTVNPASSTTEEEACSEAALAKAKKGEGDKRNASQILDKYKTKLFSDTSTGDLSKVKRVKLQDGRLSAMNLGSETSNNSTTSVRKLLTGSKLFSDTLTGNLSTVERVKLQDGRLSAMNLGSETSNISTLSVKKLPIDSSLGRESQSPAEHPIVPSNVTLGVKTPLLLTSSSTSEIVNLQREMKLLQQKNVLLEKKLQEISEERVSASEIELEIAKNNFKEILDQEVFKLKDEIRDTFNLERQELEKSLQAKLENIPGPSKPRVIHKIINTRKLDKDPTEGHLPSVELVNIGHGVQADNDIWSTVEGNTSKDDWAYSALLAVFGEQAKFYRVRKPRSKDADLRQFPTKPPVLFVLEHYYKTWLKKNPCILDEKPRRKKKEAPISDEEWLHMLQDETEEDRAKRRAVTLTAMVKHLGGLLGDKAVNMYRASKGRFQGISSSDDNSSSSSDDEDNRNMDGGENDDRQRVDDNDSDSSIGTNP